MSSEQVFNQMIAWAGKDGKIRAPINRGDYEQWKKDYIWEALHGIRYGQSFCNHFGIDDNHLYYAQNDVVWCDQYIKKHYVVK